VKAMNNKYLTTGLLGIVLVIWGTIFFKVFHSLKVSNSLTEMHFRNKPPIAIDTVYQIHAYARDPFLSILTDTAHAKVAVPEDRTVKTIPVKQIPLPAYHGLLVVNEKRTGIIKDMKKIVFVHQGEIYKEIKFCRLTEDSAIVMVDGKRKILRIEKKGK
jgi:hypothetical protein